MNQNIRFASPTTHSVAKAAEKTLAIVLAGGRGERLHGLTDRQAKPALHFGGKYRMIDFPLSNCINSGVRRIAVATQYKAHDLLHHIQRTWSFLRPEMAEFVELWPAQQQTAAMDWYNGTADAVYQNIELIRRHAPRYVLILAGDHVYKQDYSILIADHIESGAGVTIGCVEVPREEGKRFGVVNVDKYDMITRFLEKPAVPPGLPENSNRCLASMGIYVFNTDVLLAALDDDAETLNSTHDFGRDIIPSLLSQVRVQAHRLSRSCITSIESGNQPYWRDLGTLDAYWQAHIDLVRSPELLDLYNEDWRIWTLADNCAPVRFVAKEGEAKATVDDSIIGSGSIVHGAHIRRSVLSSGTKVASGAQLIESVILPGCEIGIGARLHRCILAEGCKIPAGLVVGEDQELDIQWFHRTPTGITMITPSMLQKLSGQKVVSVTEAPRRARIQHRVSSVA